MQLTKERIEEHCQRIQSEIDSFNGVSTVRDPETGKLMSREDYNILEQERKVNTNG